MCLRFPMSGWVCLGCWRGSSRQGPLPTRPAPLPAPLHCEPLRAGSVPGSSLWPSPLRGTQSSLQGSARLHHLSLPVQALGLGLGSRGGGIWITKSARPPEERRRAGKGKGVSRAAVPGYAQPLPSSHHENWATRHPVPPMMQQGVHRTTWEGFLPKI